MYKRQQFIYLITYCLVYWFYFSFPTAIYFVEKIFEIYFILPFPPIRRRKFAITALLGNTFIIKTRQKLLFNKRVLVEPSIVQIKTKGRKHLTEI